MSTAQTPRSQEKPTHRDLPRLIRGVAMGLLIAGIAWFYYWSVNPEGKVPFFDNAGADYYNRLVKGFLQGQLSLDLPADPELARMSNPYDPAQRGNHGLHDASYFKGHYYLYFGVTPALLLFAPLHLATGKYLSETFAIFIFVFSGFVVSWALLRSIIKRYFPATGLFPQLTATAMLGLATMVPALLRRAAIWEVPIACGYALFMVVLFAVWKSMEEPGKVRWLAMASLTMGLCIGARPTYLFGSAVLLAPLVWRFEKSRSDLWRTKLGWRWIGCAVVPIALVGIGLALYNYLRFGNPLEFGQAYQMAGDEVSKLKLFGVRYFLYNLRLYLFSAPGLSPYFPFITVISAPPPPPGQFGIEDPYGVVCSMPWVLLSLGTFLPLRNKPLGTLRAWVAGVWIGVVLTAMTVFCFGGATGRYMVDFVPGLTLLGAVGMLFLGECIRPSFAVFRTSLIGVLAFWSGSFGLLAGLQHNRLLQLDHPKVYQKVAHVFNYIPYAIDRITGVNYGAVELKLIFPSEKLGQVEPLVATGAEFLSDYVYVHYLEKGVIRFGFEHTSRGGVVSSPLSIDPSQAHTVRIQMASLFPPAEYPGYDLDDETLRRSRRYIEIALDGKPVLHRTADCYDATDREPSIGTSGSRPGFKQDFSGTILEARKVPFVASQSDFLKRGALRMVVRFPPFIGAVSEPLLCSGEPGKGDLIYVTYEDSKHITIGHDHWGVGVVQSQPIEIDPSRDYVLQIACPLLLGPNSPKRIQVDIDGKSVLSVPDDFYAADPDTIIVGSNPIKASTATERFTGTILSTGIIQTP